MTYGFWAVVITVAILALLPGWGPWVLLVWLAIVTVIAAAIILTGDR